MKRLLKCGKFFDSVDGSLKDNMAIFIEGNKIVRIMELNQVTHIADYEIIDLMDQFVMPGLIDAHTHCNLGKIDDYFSSYGLAYALSPAYYGLVSLPNVQEDLLAGFTTIRDMGCAGFSDIALRDAINNGIHWGPRIFTSGLPINTLGGAGDSNFQPPYQGGKQDYIRAVVCGADEARQAARLNLKYGADGLKMLATSAILGISEEAGPQELTVEEMAAIVEVGNFAGRITAAHAHGAAGIKAAVKAGAASIEHGSYMDEEAAEMMVERGTYLVPTLIVSERMLEHIDSPEIPEYAKKKTKAAEKARLEAFKICLEKGVKIAFGTDVGSPYNEHGHQAYEFELMVKLGMKPADAIISATRAASELLRWDDRIGTLEVGKFADIIAVKGNPLEDIGVLSKVSFVMKDGLVYKKA